MSAVKYLLMASAVVFLMVLAFLALFVKEHNHSTAHDQTHAENKSQPLTPKPPPLSSATPVNTVASQDKLSTTEPEAEKTTLYRWKDKEGRIHFSDQVPSVAEYEVIDNFDQGLSVVQMSKPSPSQHKNDRPQTQNKPQTHYRVPLGEKALLIEKNPAPCRWVVGRAFELYQSIQAHTGNWRSASCQEYSERIQEMHKLAREGFYCLYGYGTPAGCYK